MNLKSVGMVVGVFSAIGSVAAFGFWLAADSKKDKAIAEYAKNTAEVTFSDELKEKTEALKAVQEKADEILAKENDEFNKLYSEWSEKTKNGENKARIINDFNEKLKAWDDEHDYKGQISQLDDEFDNAIRLWKENNRYFETIKECEKKISDAKTQYDAQKTLSKTLGKVNENFEDGANEIKKAAKKIRDDIVNENNKKITDIRSEFNEYKSKMAAKVSEERAKILDIRRKALAEYEKERDLALAPLKRNSEKAKTEFLDSIKAKRTPETNDIFDEKKRLTLEKNEIEDKLFEKAEGLLTQASNEDKLACAFDAMGVSPEVFAFLASMPVIFTGCIVCKYVKFVKNVFFIMKNNIKVA